MCEAREKDETTNTTIAHLGLGTLCQKMQARLQLASTGEGQMAHVDSQESARCCANAYVSHPMRERERLEKIAMDNVNQIRDASFFYFFVLCLAQETIKAKKKRVLSSQDDEVRDYSIPSDPFKLRFMTTLK